MKICFNTKNLITLLIIVLSTIPRINAQFNNIKNDAFWKTKDGQPINSQGGGIFKFNDPQTGVKKYYWYGVHYAEAASYRNAPSVTYDKVTFESVPCYSSIDLVNWTFEGDVLTKEEVNKKGKTWVGRLGVAFIKELNKYALFVQHGSEVLIAISDSPTAEFKMDRHINMTKMIGTSNTGDQTVFTDEDTGKSYLIYSYGNGRNKIYVSEIGVIEGKVSLLDCTEVFRGESREGNCMFKRNNKYYMFASNIYGWDGSIAYYLVADDIRGPYLPTNNMAVMDGASDDFTHISQTGFFVSIKGLEQETIMYCGDRWANFAGNGLGYNQWCPLSFNGTTPYFNSLNSWNLDAQSGLWEVAKDNDFVKNGSFEADRRHIPSPVKPIQLQLTAWETEIIQGNPISLNNDNSPVLNYFNTESDRKTVVGEKSLNISDKINFKRKIFQSITSSAFVKLEDGLYQLSLKAKNSSGFNNLELYALSGHKKLSTTITEENKTWQTVTIKNISVRDGKIEIGVLADGVANAFCLIDDISLVKNR